LPWFFGWCDPKPLFVRPRQLLQNLPLPCFVAEAFRAHDPGPHPERPARYDAVLRALAALGDAVRLAEAPAAGDEELARVHDPRFLAALRALCARGGGAIDPDTVANGPTCDAVEHAAGAAVAAVDGALAGEHRVAFCAGRPPGHHAERARAMGFCFVNHVAVAAAHARALGAERVAILDWDAHHGNGTQAIFYDDPDVLYVSLHQWPFYPGTGARDERGAGAGEGATVNVPLPAGTTEREFLAAFREVALPAVRRFAPDLLLVSAGFDAHRADPLTDLGVTEGGFAEMSRALAEVDASQVYVLEGGYDLAALEASVAATLGALVDR
jgi:acetoin utilization deacetylase AcuC-like enzyme